MNNKDYITLYSTFAMDQMHSRLFLLAAWSGTKGLMN